MLTTSFIPPLAPLSSTFLQPPLPLCSKRPVTRNAPPKLRMTTTGIPDSFSQTWYHNTIAPLDIDLAAHYIPNPDHSDATRRTDRHFINQSLGFMGIIDYNSQDTTAGDHMIHYIESRVSHNASLYRDDARFDLRRILSEALERYGSPPGFSALIMDCSSNILRVAWAGACGLLVVRDDKIIFRSYSHQQAHDALEAVLSQGQLPSSSDGPDNKHQRNYWLSWGGRGSTSATGGYIGSAVSGSLSHPASVHNFTIDCEAVWSEYIELQDNDLIIAGTDGLFSNVSEKQILAFVRPVQDAEDPTLAIANNTCLGSWRWDDVDFITYYLANIATNFATATHSAPHLPFPFPPSPHVDDITVLCAACCFQG